MNETREEDEEEKGMRDRSVLCGVAKVISVLVLLSVAGALYAGGESEAKAPASGELAAEQVLVVGLTTGDLGSVDPYASTMVQDAFIAPHLYGSLVRHPLGNCGSMDFQPDLATKWELAADGLTWTFYLRKGVKWHRGFGEFTSEDVMYSLDRVKNGTTSAFRGNYDNFKEVKALDKYTVQIKTANREPFLLTKVANYYGGFIVCKKAVEKANAFNGRISPSQAEAIGTGPYMFEEYKAKDQIVFVRNDEYWDQKYTIEKIVGKYFASDGSREMALLKGEIACTIGQHDYKWLTHVMSQGIVVEPTGPIDLKALYFNLKMKPFDDRRVREAFAYAIGQHPVLEMQGKEISKYCTSPVPTDSYGHVDTAWQKYVQPNPEEARKLLAEAGYPNGLDVKLFMSTGWWYLDKFVVYQNQLKQAGINLEMTLVDHTAYGNHIRAGRNPIVIWGSRYPLPTVWLREFYHTDSMIGKPKASQNFMSYSNLAVDKLIEVAETTIDEKTRLDALAEAQRIIVQDLPSVPSIETLTPYVRNPWFDPGYVPKGDFLWSYQVNPKTRILKH